MLALMLFVSPLAASPMASAWFGPTARASGERVSAPAEEEADRAMGRYADGDDRAFGDVYRLIADRIYGFLLRQTGNATLADDLVQETFLRMHRARGSFEKGARVLPWSYAIARNVHIDHVRQGAVRKERPAGEEDDTSLDREGHEPDGEEVAVARELAEVVERTLAKLPPNQREAFILLRYEGLSVADAAEVVGATEGAVKLRAFHAYEALRAALGTEGAKKRGAK